MNGFSTLQLQMKRIRSTTDKSVDHNLFKQKLHLGVFSPLDRQVILKAASHFLIANGRTRSSRKAVPNTATLLRWYENKVSVPSNALINTYSELFIMNNLWDVLPSCLQTPQCCSGFYGPDCKPCIGGFQHPCYDKGTVSLLVWTHYERDFSRRKCCCLFVMSPSVVFWRHLWKRLL